MINNLNKLLSQNPIFFFLIYFSILFVIFIFLFMIFYWIFFKLKRKNKKKPLKIRNISIEKKNNSTLFSKINIFKSDKFYNNLKAIIHKLKGEYSSKYSANFVLSLGLYAETKRNIFRNPDLVVNNEEKIEDLLEIKTIDDTLLIDIDQKILFKKFGISNYRKHLKKIINTITKFNYLKPVSSIILKIPITEVLQIYDQNINIKKEKVKSLALQYQSLLNYIQNISGLKIPVYIFITELEEVYGFNEFVSTLSEEQKNEIFGWSNPYDLEAIYKENFFDEAMAEILLKLKLFNIDKQITDESNTFNKNIINFPYELQIYLNELREFVNIIFDNKSFNHSYAFRGIYLTGYESSIAKSPIKAKYVVEEIIAENSLMQVNKSLFVNMLYLNKIKKEIKLSSPTFNYFLSAQRYALLPKIFLPVLIVFTLFSNYNYFGKVKKYVELSEKNSTYFTSFIDKKFEQNKVVFSNNDISIKNVIYLFDIYGIFFSSDMKSILHPISYISSLNYNIDYFYSSLIRYFLLKPVKYYLINKNKSLLADNYKVNIDYNDYDINILELKDLYYFTESTWKNENYIEIYNKLSDKINIPETTKILNYTLGADLTDLFDKYNINYQLNQDTHNDTLDLRGIKPDFNKKFNDLLSLAKAGIEGDLSLFDLSNKAVERIDNIEKDLTISTAQKKFNEIYEILNKLIDNSFSVAKGGNLNIPANLQNPIERIRIVIQKSVLLSDEKSAQIYENKIKDAISLRNSKSLTFSSQILGPIFLAKKADKNKNENEIVISPIITESIGIFDKFKEKSYVQNNINLKLPENIEISEKYKWSENDMEYLEDSLIELDKFLSNDAKNLNQKFVNLLTKYSAQSISFEMLQRIKHSDDLLDNKNNNQRSLKEKILLFNQNIKRNMFIMRKLKEIGAQKLYKSFEFSFNDDISNYLSYIQEYFNKKGFFNPKNSNFKWWNGIDNIVFQAYMVNDFKDLNDYIEIQKEEINKIRNDYVASLIELSDFIGSSKSQNDLKNILYWKNNITALDSKAKDSSYLVFQDFIVNFLPKLNSSNCLDSIEKYNFNSNLNDFFVEKQKNLIALLKNQCNELIENYYKNEYDKLATYFNKEISGKFPFSPNMPNSSNEELDIDKFSNLYIMFNSFKKLDKYKNLISDETKWKSSLDFLKKLDNVFKIFQFDNEKSDAEQLKLNFQIDLKLAKSYEENTESIVEREIDFGNKQLSTTNRVKKMSWEFLDPTVVTLRWAKDYPVFPTLSNEKIQNLYNIENGDKKLTIQFNNKWSIFALQRKYSNQFNSDFSTQYIKLNVPIKKPKNKNNKDNLESNLAKIVMKISVENIDKQYIPIPAFPTEAPYLNNVVTKVEGSNIWK